MAREQVVVYLRCCNERVKVTGRRSKQNERGRFHNCPQCGKRYLVIVKDGKLVGCVG